MESHFHLVNKYSFYKLHNAKSVYIGLYIIRRLASCGNMSQSYKIWLPFFTFEVDS